MKGGKAAGGKLVQASLAVDTCPFSSAGPKLEDETCQFLLAINLADSTFGSRVVQGTGVVIRWGFQSLSLMLEAFPLFMWDCVAPRSSCKTSVLSCRAAALYTLPLYIAAKGETGKVTKLHLQRFKVS